MTSAPPQPLVRLSLGIGASIAGMRHFGDFERFAAISDVTAEQLDNVHRRIRLLRDASEC